MAAGNRCWEDLQLVHHSRRGRAVTLLVPLVMGGLLAAGLVAMADRNLGYTGMWWDESASFWNSQGLGRYAEPFAARRGWRDVVRLNRVENLDPGGHTLLLHLWTSRETALERLRSLSFLFFAISCAALGALGFRLTRSAAFALAAAAMLLLYPAARYFALEIRAYSMEMAGVAVVALLVALTAQRPTGRRLALLGIVGAAFLSSRYSFVLVLVAAAVALAWAWLRQGDALKAVTRRLALAALPVALAGAAIAWATLRFQLWQEMRIGPLGLAAPLYTRGAVLGATAEPFGLLRANLLTPAALPITFAIVLFLAWRCRGARVPADVDALYVVVLAAQVISAAVSAVGLYPWDLRSRWSAYLIMVSAVAAVTVAADLTAAVRSHLARPSTSVSLRRFVPAVCVVAAAFSVALGAAAGAGHRQWAETEYRADLARQLDLLPAASLGPGTVFVTFYEVPSLRYLYEHGPYGGRAEYPQAFRFETEAEFWQRRPIDAASEGIRFVLTGLPLHEVKERLPGAALVPVSSAGSRLLAVTVPVADGAAQPAPGNG